MNIEKEILEGYSSAQEVKKALDDGVESKTILKGKVINRNVQKTYGSINAQGVYTSSTVNGHIVYDIRDFVGSSVSIVGASVQWGFMSVYDINGTSTWIGGRQTTSTTPCKDITIPQGAIYLYIYIGGSNDIPGVTCDGERSSLVQDVEFIKEATKTISPLKVRFINGNGVDSSTERFCIYQKSTKGYIRYDFVHTVVDDGTSRTNANVWRIAYAVACDDNLNELFNITTAGEWILAVKLFGRSDFSGGYAHGDNVFTNIAFFADGCIVDKNAYLNTHEVKEFKVVQADDLYDPNDNATIIAHHGSEHIFTNNGLYVNQWLEWVGEHVLSNTFLAMHLPSKSVTNKFYTDRDYNVRDTISGSDIVVKKAKKASVFNADGSCNTECSVVKYPSGLKGGDIFTMSDNGGGSYNKCYFYVTKEISRTDEAVNQIVKNGDTWEASLQYRFDVC